MEASKGDKLEYESTHASATVEDTASKSTHPCLARSQMKDFKDASLNPWPIQLNDGLRLYTNCLPGKAALIWPAKPTAFSTLGSAVSSHKRSAYGANSVALLVAAGSPAL